MTEKNDVPQIELYKVESTVVHASKMSRNSMIACVCAMIIAVISIAGIVWIVDIFTTKYNSRTKDWLDTLKLFKPAVTEVWNGETEALQQLPSP